MTAEHPPRLYRGVMISSTFTDLEKHRTALIRAIKGHELTDVAMENDAAKADVDVIDSSLQMVQDASAYVGVISRKYGQTPFCPRRNPNRLSLTELEFDEALRLGRPILLFIMGEKHSLCEADVETDPEKRQKLQAFRERAKKLRSDSAVHRVYATFDSPEEFTAKATQSVAGLRAHLERTTACESPPPVAAPANEAEPESIPIPTPPDFYAEPPYIGSHEFFGRQAQLDILDDWALAADPHPVLLFDAIGGSGKSMLTWQWVTRHATDVRDDWAGRFWYSFYERGAVMADFCRRALAYVTGEPVASFNKMKTPQLGERLLRHLQERPWLLVLDGLERVLVAYHRFDAAQVPDHEIDQATDLIGQRDPCSAIRPEDDDLLRSLAAAAPSKLLVTSRLIPRVLLNASNQSIPGVRREPLPGLRPADAEALFRACGVAGDSQTIQDYLKRNCDCHPLVTGVLAGLVNDYLPDKGNFDAWMADPIGGGRLDLADLNLIQKRSHILEAALDALPEKSRELLSTLALLSQAADYAILSALNPHLPGKPEHLMEPTSPQNWRLWESLSASQQERRLNVYTQKEQEYQGELNRWRHSPEYISAQSKLSRTIRDLEQRGLLEYDRSSKRYDLHPVVRGVAAGNLAQTEAARYGKRVVDHFSRQSHDPYEQAETMDDVRVGLQVVRTYLMMGRLEDAEKMYTAELSATLLINLEAHDEILSLLQPFFPNGWPTLQSELVGTLSQYLANDAAVALKHTDQQEASLSIWELTLSLALKEDDYRRALVYILNVISTLKHPRAQERLVLKSISFATLISDPPRLFKSRLSHYSLLVAIGRWEEAMSCWSLLDAMGRDWPREIYRPGDAEFIMGRFHLQRGDLDEDTILEIERLAGKGKNRPVIRRASHLRGRWRFERGELGLAAESLHKAVRMAREVGKVYAEAESYLALAKLHLQRLADPIAEAERLAQAKRPAHYPLAELWLAIGERERAKEHALAAYREAWADGEPYVYRYDLNKARALLERLEVPIPQLPPYDSAKTEKFPWEDAVEAAIEKLRAEKEAEPRES